MLSNISYCFSTRPIIYKTPLHCQDLPVLSISTKACLSWRIHYDHRTLKLLRLLYSGWFLQASALDMEHKVRFPVSAAASPSILSLCSASIIDSFILQSNVPSAALNIKMSDSLLISRLDFSQFFLGARCQIHQEVWVIRFPLEIKDKSFSPTILNGVNKAHHTIL